MCKKIFWLGGYVLVVLALTASLQAPAWAATPAEDRNTPHTESDSFRKDLDRGVEIDPNG
jgi:hypothetical protein